MSSIAPSPLSLSLLLLAGLALPARAVAQRAQSSRSAGSGATQAPAHASPARSDGSGQRAASSSSQGVGRSSSPASPQRQSAPIEAPAPRVPASPPSARPTVSNSDSGFRGARATVDTAASSGARSRQTFNAPSEGSSAPTPRPYDSARYQPTSSVGREASPPLNRGPEGSRTETAPSSSGFDSRRAFDADSGSWNPGDSRPGQDRSNRVYRPDSGPEFSGWAPVRVRVPVMAGSAREQTTGPASSRKRNVAHYPPSPGMTDSARAPGNRASLGQQSLRVHPELMTRESLLQRYRRAGELSTSPTRAAARPGTGADRSLDVSKARGFLASPVPSKPLVARSHRPDVATQAARTTASQDRSPLAQSRAAQRSGVSRLARLNASDPDQAQRALQRGEAVALATDLGVRVAVSASCGWLVPPSNDCAGWGAGAQAWNPCYKWCWSSAWWWGCSSLWWPCWGPSWGFGYWFDSCGFWSFGSPYYCQPTAYYYCPPPVYYSYVIYEQGSPTTTDESVILLPDPEPVAYLPESVPGEGAVDVTEEYSASAAAERSAAVTSTRARAASEYLSLGDRAFREGRYSDAVYAYARAVEFTPEDAVLHLILSDALFATGDYHYCAFALRRAIELEPRLVDSIVDKHNFYADPGEFDRQLSLLERYLEDHFVDDDARLVLAANYLFANRPAQTSNLLDSAFSLAVRESIAGQVIAKRAQALLGANPPRN